MERHQLGVADDLDAGGGHDVADVEGLVELDAADVDGDALGDVARLRLDGQLVEDLLVLAARADAGGLADADQLDDALDDLVGADAVEVDVEDASGQGVDLDLLDDGAADGALLVGELEEGGVVLDQAGVGLGDGQGDGGVAVGVEDGGDLAGAAEAAAGGGAQLGARAGADADDV